MWHAIFQIDNSGVGAETSILILSSSSHAHTQKHTHMQRNNTQTNTHAHTFAFAYVCVTIPKIQQTQIIGPLRTARRPRTVHSPTPPPPPQIRFPCGRNRPTTLRAAPASHRISDPPRRRQSSSSSIISTVVINVFVCVYRLARACSDVCVRDFPCVRVSSVLCALSSRVVCVCVR